MMDFSGWALLVSGGVTLVGIAYPTYAQSKPGWKIGAWVGGDVWSLWFGMGGLAYLAGMANVFGWLGLLGAIPLAFLIGLALIVIVGRHMQLLALPGPILSNIWFMT